MQYLEYKEFKQRGTVDFPIELYHVDGEHPQYEMPYHWHSEYEIIRILQGEVIVFIDQVEYNCGVGDIIFINSGSLHSALPKNCVYECIVFDMNMLLRNNDVCKYYIDQFIDHTKYVEQHITNNQNYKNVIWDLFDDMQQRYEGFELRVKGLLYEMLGIIMKEQLFMEDILQKPSNYKSIIRLKNVFEFIEESYSSTITLDDLSKTAGMSSKHFCRFFKEITHKSPMNYLNYYRVERSCYHLINSDMSITDIAYSCGFNDFSYYIKTFKRYKGETPNSYRKKDKFRTED